VIAHADPLRSLEDALRGERGLVDDLAGLVRRQREALGTDDLAAVEETVYATHRVLLTLREAQRRPSTGSSAGPRGCGSRGWTMRCRGGWTAACARPATGCAPPPGRSPARWR
jgi:hypothetical protein